MAVGLGVDDNNILISKDNGESWEPVDGTNPFGDGGFGFHVIQTRTGRLVAVGLGVGTQNIWYY